MKLAEIFDGFAQAQTNFLQRQITVDAVRLTVSYGGREVRLTQQLFVMFTIIAAAKHGTTPQRIFDQLFDGDRDGGPLTGSKTIQVQRLNLNRRLQPLGLVVTSAGSGSPALYTLAVQEAV
jgi:hypothetical protein